MSRTVFPQKYILKSVTSTISYEASAFSSKNGLYRYAKSMSEVFGRSDILFIQHSYWTPAITWASMDSNRSTIELLSMVNPGAGKSVVIGFYLE